MARVFVTGSSTGLGLMAGELLVEQGHRVVLHARNQARADDARRAPAPGRGGRAGRPFQHRRRASVADEANKLGRFDAIIHNAGVGYREAAADSRRKTAFRTSSPINVLAPYVLTALIERPDRLVYLSSGMHRGANAPTSTI